ncbi:hypothetical protein PHYPSEUDO_007538 [Phytophthora pseudosyringae]|uniref:Uncharacterized protein n=1 Tax=Phytophthora pseudosyringae TaxID=221518 RepID=A0A8T1WD45_9STRA|nr:hypothetical protein PHYPSEUDO_007538 [Phytophthora pseudosyringae]
MLAPAGTTTSSASAQRYLQGLLTRRSTAAEPKNAAQYFGHVADVVGANEQLTRQRTYNLKRRAKVAYKGYEAVLSRKKRAAGGGGSVKPSAANAQYVSRPAAPSASAFNPAAVLQLQAMLPRAQPVAVKPAPKLAAATSVIPSTTLTAPTVTSSVAAATPGRMTSAQIQLHQQQMKNAQLQQQQTPRRADFVVGTTVLIRSTADLVACGARNLAGKTGRIVAAPQVYGQELYSVYINEHEALFQVPFNALTLVARPTPAQQQQAHTTQQMQQMQAQLAAAGGRLVPNHAQRGSKSAEQVKMEHSFQLHRLMQQQYREIQVLQQRYAECRIVDPTALSGIQKELSKLRLVHLSQVQTLKSKQALDMIGK